jgi:hypothetical protein
MRLNIYKTIKDLNFHKKNMLLVFFTPFPYEIYKISNNKSNFAINGVGLGLIRCQRVFWCSVIFLLSIFYFKKYLTNFIFYLFVSSGSYLCIISILNSVKLLRYLNISGNL